MSVLHLSGIDIDVQRKSIKNIHLSVLPPTGAVRISAPHHVNVDTIRVFALTRLAWIKKQQKKFVDQIRETPREYIDRESHYFEGRRYFLEIVEQNAPPKVELESKRITLYIRPETTEDKKKQILTDWYRQKLKNSIENLISQWETRLEVKVEKFTIQQMKTLWGSCTPERRSIRLNLELAKKPTECLEYIVVHELLHLLEPTHNKHFIELLDKHLPQWRRYREMINTLPVKHEHWDY